LEAVQLRVDEGGRPLSRVYIWTLVMALLVNGLCVGEREGFNGMTPPLHGLFLLEGRSGCVMQM